MEENTKNRRKHTISKDIAEAETESILKPKVKRTAAQEAAFEKARETRALNIKKRQELRELKEDVKVAKQSKAYDKVAVRHERARRVSEKVEKLKEAKTKLINRKKIALPTYSSEGVTSSATSENVSEYSISEESSSEEEVMIAKAKKKAPPVRAVRVSKKPVKKIAPARKPRKVVYHYESSSEEEVQDYSYEPQQQRPSATSSYLSFFN